MTAKETLTLLDNMISDSVEWANTNEDAGYYKGVLMMVWALVEKMIEKLEEEAE